MTRRSLIAWQMGGGVLMGAAPFLLIAAAGCSTANTAAAAQNAAKAAAANIAQSAAAATAANTTITVNTSTAAAGAVVSPTAPKTIWGRWTRTGQIINPDGSFTDGLLSEITFEHNGSFTSTGRTGVAAVGFMKGTFQIFGNVLTTKIGKLQQTMTFQIKGSELFLTNSKSHQVLVFQRG